MSGIEASSFDVQCFVDWVVGQGGELSFLNAIPQKVIKKIKFSDNISIL